MISMARVLCLAWLFAGVTACGGSGSNDAPPRQEAQEPAPSPPPARGALIQNPPVRVLSINSSEVSATAGRNTAGQRLLQLIAAPK